MTSMKTLRKIRDRSFEKPKLKKIEGFQKSLKKLILSQEITNNEKAFLYTLNQGHIGKHAAEEIKKMKEDGLITFDSRSPLVTYQKVVREKVKLNYKLT